PAVIDLIVDDFLQVERSRHQHDTQYRHAQGNLITDELSAGAQRAEHAVLAVRRPAAQHNAVNGEAADGEVEDDANINVRPNDKLHALQCVQVVIRYICIKG